MSPFQIALNHFQAAKAAFDAREEASEMDVECLRRAMDAVMAVPAATPVEAGQKLGALCDFYEGGEVPVEQVAIVVGELSGFSGSTS